MLRSIPMWRNLMHTKFLIRCIFDVNTFLVSRLQHAFHSTGISLNIAIRIANFACVLFIVVLLVGCSDSGALSKNKTVSNIVSIRCSNGMYLCTDVDRNYMIAANRNHAALWESFQLRKIDSTFIEITAFDQSPIRVASAKDNMLTCEKISCDSCSFFKMEKSSPGTFFLKDFKDRYVAVDSNNLLYASEADPSGAASFRLVSRDDDSHLNFSRIQLLPLFTGALLLLIAVLLFLSKENKSWSIFFLVAGSLSLRLFGMLLNQHLNVWDEQFHALVAKNMMSAPFEPMLYKNLLLPAFDSDWTMGHIWLHKQPLFLWQMALSMKIFGVNVIALRLPSLLMSTAVTYLIYRIGSVTINKSAGFYGALLFAFSNFAIGLASGAYHTDHNDTAFLFYVCISVWAWMEYEIAAPHKKMRYVLLIGLLAGCAVLVKWLPGLLVFSGWGLSILLVKERREKWVHYRNIITSFLVAIGTFLPWQIYILRAFPVASRHEFSLNSNHFFDVVEGHQGDAFYHVSHMDEIYGISFLILLPCVVVLFLSLKNVVWKVAFPMFILIIYVFFSIAATKMIAFTFCISFLIYLSMGTALHQLTNGIWKAYRLFSIATLRMLIASSLIVLLCIVSFNYDKFKVNHLLIEPDEYSYLSIQIIGIPYIKSISNLIPDPENWVVLNCRHGDNIQVMFFSEVAAAYPGIPDQVQVEQIMNAGYKIIVFDDDQLPEFIRTDSEIIKVVGYWDI